jgi:intracellular multiplication protein IcmL
MSVPATQRLDQFRQSRIDASQQIIYALIIAMLAMLVFGSFVVFQIVHRPIPVFYVKNPTGRTIQLTAYDEPNYLPQTILTWASKAAVAAYTFNFATYNKTIPLARPYFTEGGWAAYQRAIGNVISRVVKAQLIVQGVVTGPPVIANQGELPGHGYSWRVQIPFLVTYLSAGESKSQTYYVIMMVVKVPTTVNPQGIGIDTFDMR